MYRGRQGAYISLSKDTLSGGMFGIGTQDKAHRAFGYCIFHEQEWPVDDTLAALPHIFPPPPPPPFLRSLV